MILYIILLLKFFLIWLNYYQQSHYHSRQFLKSVGYINIHKKQFYFLNTLVLVSIVNLFVKTEVLHVFEVILTLVKIILYFKPIVKLKFTSRVKRIILTFGTIILLLRIFILKDNSILAAFALILPLVVVLIDKVLLPINYLICKKYIDQSLDKMMQNPNLIKICITGSAGKTTTKFMLKEILSASIVVAATEKSYNTILGISSSINKISLKNLDAMVFEFGASHKNDIKQLVNYVYPDVAIITSVLPQHMSTFKTIENVLRTKTDIFDFNNLDQIKIANFDNPLLNEYLKYKVNEVTTIGLSKEFKYNAQNIEYSLLYTEFDLYKYDKFLYRISVNGTSKNCVTNALCAIACANELEKKGIYVSNKQIKQKLNQMSRPESRQVIKKYASISIIDNSYNSNIESFKHMSELISTLSTKKVIITPGIVDAGKKTEELNTVAASYIKNVFDEIILIECKTGKIIGDELKNTNELISYFKTFKQAYSYALEKYKTTPTTLLIENDLPDANLGG